MCSSNGNTILTTPLRGSNTATVRHYNNTKDEVTVSVYKAYGKARIRIETTLCRS